MMQRYSFCFLSRKCRRSCRLMRPFLKVLRTSGFVCTLQLLKLKSRSLMTILPSLKKDALQWKLAFQTGSFSVFSQQEQSLFCCSNLQDIFNEFLFCRNKLLELHLQQLELFDRALLIITQKSENLLSSVRSSCRVDVSDLGGAMNTLKVSNLTFSVYIDFCGLAVDCYFTNLSFWIFSPKEHEAQLHEFAVLRETLNQRETSVLCFCTPEAQQQLQDWKKDCLQPLAESQRLISIRKDCLTSLKLFLEKCEGASKAVSRLQEAVEGRGSWDHFKAEELLRGIMEVAKDMAQLEGDAVTLDGKLSKAHMQICGPLLKDREETGQLQGRTSCREKVVALTMALEEVQRGVGWRQSEADALGDLWCSFRKRKEEVMKNLKKLENDARQEGCIECSVQAFQNRYVDF